ncbi:MAG: hypothetical protein ACE5EI_07240 [Thermodesulfobacteriota bacterium]
MRNRAGALVKKGYIPLAMNEYGGISWQGERIDELWMWNRQFNVLEDGTRTIQTARVTELKEAALRYWRDGWVPVGPVDDGLLRRMEDALRSHQGLRRAGVSFPGGRFLGPPEEIPEEFKPAGRRSAAGAGDRRERGRE